MVLAIVVGIGATLFGTLIRPTGEITLTQAASTILAAIAVFGLAVFVPGIAAGLVSGAPQLGAGSAVATTAALGGSAVAGGMLASGAARLAGRAAGGSIRAAAALTGRVGAAYEAGGAARRGAYDRHRTGLAHDRFGHGTCAGRLPRRCRPGLPRCTAASRFRRCRPRCRCGRRRGNTSRAPAWAQSLARRQRLTQAGLLAAGALREGDRPVGGGGPDLKDKS